MENSVAGKKVLVVGAGESGLAAARLLGSLGAVVNITDQKSPQELEEAQAAAPKEVRWLFGPQPLETYLGSDLIVISPGVPFNHDGLVAARAQGIEVIGELELAFRHLNIPILAVTGSNGKTTTTALTGEILAKTLGRPQFVGGNIGNPLANLALKAQRKKETLPNWAVVEVSSFQLETVKYFRARAAAFLNLSQDHLDRHVDMAEYFRSKSQIFKNQGENDWGILNEDDFVLAHKFVPGVRFGFSRRNRPAFGGWVNETQGKVSLAVVKGNKILAQEPWSEFALEGAHNQENVLAAVGLAMAAGVEPGAALQAAKDFAPGDHRLSLVGECRGVRYYDDSKGTNVGAVIRALESFPESIILIAGGRDKGLDYSLLRPYVEKKVRAAFLIGECREKMRLTLRGTTWIRLMNSMESAVDMASRVSKPGEVVLLSPACSSFDMFDNYKARGEAFAKAVRALIEREAREAS
ncbi:MAG: UDP-N-acetylmuramoyl-L-alanine--D-glutamate ligase [Deltaproteobacteria bacterium]|jgi:UDP-N-acetylmuramoylalanine--D-glutamate ligase|nr:UDP-N-acetylmuramoyl-L-alanine--D-glutamate ligase [Deltaproteobacteria bacterium]